jgi:hypothetical protein
VRGRAATAEEAAPLLAEWQLACKEAKEAREKAAVAAAAAAEQAEAAALQAACHQAAARLAATAAEETQLEVCLLDSIRGFKVLICAVHCTSALVKRGFAEPPLS